MDIKNSRLFDTKDSIFFIKKSILMQELFFWYQEHFL